MAGLSSPLTKTIDPPTQFDSTQTKSIDLPVPVPPTQYDLPHTRGKTDPKILGSRNPEKLETPRADDISQITWEWAVKHYIVAGYSRIESYEQYWKDRHGSFGDWCVIYPALKESQKREAQWETWVLDEDEMVFKKLNADDEKTNKPCIARLQMKDDDEDVFWYFWDYDTGMKKRMNGIAARQIECGYQCIKERDYEVLDVLRSGVKATEGIYKQLNTSYKLSYQVAPAAQKGQRHISVYQINVHTGFQRLLERFPPETTPAKIKAGSFMEVFLLYQEETETSIIVDFLVQGGRTHFQQVWLPSVIRFEIDSPLPENRKQAQKLLLKLWSEKKLVSIGHNANVELKQDARQVKDFVLSLNHESKLPERRDALSCKLAIMNHMQELRMSEKQLSNEVALSSTREHFGQHFFSVFATESRFRKEFLRQYNETFVRSYDHVPFDLFEITSRADKLHIQKDGLFSLSYIFDPRNGNSITFAAVDCDRSQPPVTRTFMNKGFVESDKEMDSHFNQTVERHRVETVTRSRSYMVSGIQDILIEDAVFDTAIKSTREVENMLILTSFPFDEDHIYVFRNGAVVRANRSNCAKLLKKIAHIQPGQQRVINDMQILSVETYADGSVSYGCRPVSEKKNTLTRRRLHQIQHQERLADADEKELETSTVDVPESHQSFVQGPVVSSDTQHAHDDLLEALDSLQDHISEFGKVVSSFCYMDEGAAGRRSEGPLLYEFISYAAEKRNQMFPTLAVFKGLDWFTPRDEIKLLFQGEEDAIPMGPVIAACIHCYNNRSVLGLAAVNNTTYLFEIDVGGNSGKIGVVTEELHGLGLDPRAVLTKSDGIIRLSSRYIRGANQDGGLTFDVRTRSVGEALVVKFGECQVLENVFEDNSLSKIESIVDNLHEWSNDRKRVGRPGRFAVYFAQSLTFEWLRPRLKKTKQREANDQYDPNMELLEHFSMEKWKTFTNKTNRDNPCTVYVMIVDHDVYTFRRVEPTEGRLQTAVENAYGIDSANRSNSFLYQDTDVLNIRDACTSRGFYVELRVAAHSILRCPICMEVKDSSSTLSCGHSSCHQCLRQQLKYDNNDCSLCRHDLMHPFMIPRPSQGLKEIAHQHYGALFDRALQYQSFKDDVIWNTQIAQDRGPPLPAAAD